LVVAVLVVCRRVVWWCTAVLGRIARLTALGWVLVLVLGRIWGSTAVVRVVGLLLAGVGGLLRRLITLVFMLLIRRLLWCRMSVWVPRDA
jgi:hypothetical protein